MNDIIISDDLFDLFSVIEGLDKKKVIMAKARHEDASIRENALLALQKIMLHNWSASQK